MWARVEQTMARQVRRLRPIARIDADATTQAVATQIERDFGAFVPPFALHAAAPELLAACWTMLRESLAAQHVERRCKEAIASAVSRSNACTYCVDAHTAALHALGESATADALATAAGAPSGPLARWVAWAAATRTPDAPALRHPPFPPAAVPEAVGIAFSFHYINRMVTIFLAPSPLPFGSPRLKALARRVIAPVLTGMLARPLAPGESLQWLPDAPLPADFAWAAGNPTIAAAFARAAAAFERAGDAAVPSAVRNLVREHLQTWVGEEMGLGRGWLVEAIANLPPELHPMARLTLLTSFAPHQIDDEIVAAVGHEHGDATLIAATGWASFTTARRIASWMSGQPGTSAGSSNP